MSEYQDFLQERDRLDFMIQQGYSIKNIIENLSGAFVELENKEGEKETLQILTPDGRKYFSVLLLKQQKTGAL
ncbi:hypothetical protein [Mesobacillus subterraneus]|uniref:Uncharacterized protein n=1 Tax=Mesobacillus subterraneus TaxID=285983 RepID=A0A3R9F3C6_9BACI|nr:hypothetical protein [Mesobacillus subterraneus]RSD28966.1 hypothetical protein EJA10_02315 [Mesobacillus subterraneus]